MEYLILSWELRYFKLKFRLKSRFYVKNGEHGFVSVRQPSIFSRHLFLMLTVMYKRYNRRVKKEKVHGIDTWLRKPFYVNISH